MDAPSSTDTHLINESRTSSSVVPPFHLGATFEVDVDDFVFLAFRHLGAGSVTWSSVDINDLFFRDVLDERSIVKSYQI